MSDTMAGKPLVIDNGTGLSKNGYAGEDQPRTVFPTLIGYPKYQSIMSDVDHYVREYYVGEEAMNLRGVLKLMYQLNTVSLPIGTPWKKFGTTPSITISGLTQVNTPFY